MPTKRSNPYDSNSDKPFKLSRSKIDMFLECPKCFYMDRRLGISRPSGPAFSLNIAVDALLKKEFDVHRANGSKHPLMESYGLDAIPVAHELLDQWRHNFTGVQCHHKKTNMLIKNKPEWENYIASQPVANFFLMIFYIAIFPIQFFPVFNFLICW